MLFKNDTGYEVLTQMRWHPPVIEVPGGGLQPKETWRDGARRELFEEAGVNVNNNNLIFLQGGNPRISMNNNLYGNANFFTVFKTKPATNDNSPEIDKNYGHKWLDLKTLYEEVLKEQQSLSQQHKPKDHGKYYSFFRGHLLTFCKHVISCDKL